MGILIIFLILIYTALGYLLLNKSTILKNGLSNLIISFFLSISVVTLFFFLTVLLNLPFVGFLVISFGFILGVAAFTFYKYKRVVTPSFKIKILPWYILVAAFLFVFTYRFHFDRWGSWDAWAIWNLHAKFLAGSNFSDMFSKSMEWSHLDYPLMLPSLVALLWKAFGIVPVIPALVAYLFSALIPLSSFASLYDRKLVIPAFFILILYSIDAEFVILGSQQYADTILSLSILLTFVLYNHLQTDNDNKYEIAIMGFLSVTCGWIKNEGLLFFAIFTLFFVVRNFKKFNVLKYYFSGLAFPLIVLIIFKIYYTPANDLVSGQGESTLHKLFDISRYTTAATYFWNLLLSSYPVWLLIIALFLAYMPKALASFQFGVLMTLLMGYFMVYIVTPHDLNWHLATSCTRLFHHIYPAFVYCMLFKLKDEHFNIDNMKLLK